MHHPVPELQGLLQAQPPLPTGAELRLDAHDLIQLSEHGRQVTFQVSLLLGLRLRHLFCCPCPHAERHSLHARESSAHIASNRRLLILEVFPLLLRTVLRGVHQFEASINILAQDCEHLMRG